MGAPRSSYNVRVVPASRTLEIELTAEGLTPGPVSLAVPTWVPGAYGFMKYARDLYDLAARDPRTGAPVELTRDGWSGWVAAAGQALHLSYTAHAGAQEWAELAGFVGAEQAVLLGTRYLRPAGAQGPVRVSYELPEGWAMHHPSGAREVGPSTWEYPSYEALLDTPVVAGAFERVTKALHGAEIHFVFLDRPAGFEREKERLVDALCRVAEGCHAVFGSFPFESYSFICSFDPLAHWGLEHANGTMIAPGEHALIDKAAWLDTIRVAGHEIFHAWNVCRLKPAPLGAPDLVAGSFPDGLWVSEGFTRYYEFLLAARAGELSAEDFFSNVVNYYRHLAALPAYALVTAADSSRATFLNHGRAFAGSAHHSIDYYDKGMLIAFDMDAMLRSSGAGTLDHEVRAFYDAWAGKGQGFTSADARGFFASRVPAIGDLLEREVERPGGLSVVEQLQHLGFEVSTAPVRQLGLLLEKDLGPGIANTLGPAQEAGLAAGDEIVKVGGLPWSLKSLRWRIEHEEQIALEVRRGHRYISVAVRPGERQEVSALRWTGSEAQAASIRSWLGASFEPTQGQAMRLDAYQNFHGTQTVI